jgi:hypothetical protein
MTAIEAITTSDALAWAIGLIGVLWGVTLILAGLLGKSINDKIGDMSRDLKEIVRAHASLEATVQSERERVERIEDAVVRIDAWRFNHRVDG